MKRPLLVALTAAALLMLAQPAVTAVGVVPGVFHRPIVGHQLRNDTIGSTNWSGYAVEASAEFSTATATWVQPAASCTTPGRTYASFWVGLDGYSTDSVEQLGTDADCASMGRPSYYAWWEMYPAGSVNLSRAAYPVAPGDTLTASVSHIGTSYTLTLTDINARWTYSTPQTANDANASAEWIVESPEVCSRFSCSNTNLTDFGSMAFTGSQAAVVGGALQPISSFTTDGGPHAIIMVTSLDTFRAQPSGLTSGGQDFTDTWEHS